jgi:hypothetical protein
MIPSLQSLLVIAEEKFQAEDKKAYNIAATEVNKYVGWTALKILKDEYSNSRKKTIPTRKS